MPSGALGLDDPDSNLGSASYGFVTWTQLLNLFGPQFPLLQNGNNNRAR